MPDAPPTQTSEQKPLPEPVKKTVGSTGGQVTSSDGSGVEIPQGAVPGDVDISVAPAPNAPPPPQAEAVVGTPYVLGPSGLQFAKPVTIVLTFDPSKLPAGKSAADILVFTAPDGTTDYKPLVTRIRDASHVEADTTHFSVFVPTVAPDTYDAGFTDPGTGTDAGSSCTPVLCGFYGPGACGALEDQCGGKLDCGTCPTTTAPDAGTGSSDAGGGKADGGTSTGGGDASAPADAGTTAPDAGSGSKDAGAGSGDGGTCMALTCANYGGCGVYNDGCGGTVDCTTNCADGGAGGGNDAGISPSDGGGGGATDGGPCTPTKTCANAPGYCGYLPNECGGEYCTDGCDGGGATMDAGTGGGGGTSDSGATCDPIKACGMAGNPCGPVDNGCGQIVDCTPYCGGGGGGAVDAGTGGGGGGTTDAGPCTPMKTCGDMGANFCGPMFDGCGQVFCTDGCDGGGATIDAGAGP